MSFAIGIPTLNRFDLLHPALLFYLKDFPNTDIYIVDNGRQGIRLKITDPRIIVYEQSTNLGVAGSWNLLCDTIFKKHTHALLLNDDIYLGRKEAEIDIFLREYKKDFYASPRDWASYILPRTTYERIGKFDTLFFPAYCEDVDYEYRMKLARMEMFRVPFLIPVIYRNSSTLEKEPSIQDKARLNRKKYLDKWGGEPTKEQYKTPFGK